MHLGDWSLSLRNDLRQTRASGSPRVAGYVATDRERRSQRRDTCDFGADEPGVTGTWMRGSRPADPSAIDEWRLPRRERVFQLGHALQQAACVPNAGPHELNELRSNDGGTNAHREADRHYGRFFTGAFPQSGPFANPPGGAFFNRCSVAGV